MIELKNFKKLSFDTEEEKLKAINDLESFIATPGWIFLKRYIELNISEMERRILENELAKDAKYSEEDLEKAVRLFIKKLINLPEEEINLLKGVGDDTENFDPYERVKK